MAGKSNDDDVFTEDILDDMMCLSDASDFFDYDQGDDTTCEVPTGPIETDNADTSNPNGPTLLSTSISLLNRSPDDSEVVVDGLAANGIASGAHQTTHGLHGPHGSHSHSHFDLTVANEMDTTQQDDGSVSAQSHSTWESDCTSDHSHSIRSTSSRQRNPLTELARAGMKAVKDIGACWRCKILRKKCDPSQPCKACPRPEYTSPWRIIGCKRGTLSQQMGRISLCPESNPRAPIERGSILSGRRGTVANEMAETLVNDALQRLVAVLSDPNDSFAKATLEILCSTATVSTTLQSGQYFRLGIHDDILTIVWEFIRIRPTTCALFAESIEDIAEILKAAAVYESEYGHSSAVPMAIKCLRNCLIVLQISHGGLLSRGYHHACRTDKCCLDRVETLNSSMMMFLDELSRVMFRKENRQNERKWWLSTFYALWIFAFIRRAILVLAVREATLERFQPFLECSMLPLQLFIAASATYDPLISTWSLEKQPDDPTLDFRLMKYYRLAQKALQTRLWPQSNIRSSFEYLLNLYKNGLAVHDWSMILPAPGMPVAFPFHVGVRTIGTQNSDTGAQNNSTAPPSRSDSSALQSPMLRVGPQPTKSNGKRRAASPPSESSSLSRKSSCSSMSDISVDPIFTYGTDTSSPWHGSSESLNDLPTYLPPAHVRSASASSSFTSHSGILPSISSSESLSRLPKTLREWSFDSTSGTRSSLTCTCCKRKPRQFNTVVELRTHEAEKQYECRLCGKRFRNKNEAMRHENSLHVRRHDWSCSALGSPQSAFHSKADVNDVDMCCFCGATFLRSGSDAADKQVKVATKQDWDERIRHLQEIHKFRDCNLTKRFYRADHFRQHLKHSHAGLFGPWTNYLESACMSETIPDGPSRLSALLSTILATDE